MDCSSDGDEATPPACFEAQGEGGEEGVQILDDEISLTHPEHRAGDL